MHTFDVIIIGAGISGLSAARTLIQNGIENILILEAKEKAGGRIRSEICGDSFVELGAQWIHGEENELFELVTKTQHLHDTSSWEGKGEFRTSSGLCIDETIVTEILDWIETALEEVEDNITIELFQDNPEKWGKGNSMGRHLLKEFHKYLESCKKKDIGSRKIKDALFQWGMSFQRIDNSCNTLGELSLFRFSEYRASGEHVYKNFNSGAQNFVDEILVDSSLKSKLRLKTPIRKIDWTDDIVKITSCSQESFLCSSVIVTCSIGVLKSLPDLFSPSLPPTLAKAIMATGYGPVTKIFLEWDTPWWNPEFLGIQLVHEDYINCCSDVGKDEKIKDLSETWCKAITGFDPCLDNPRVLLAWLGGPEAVYVENLNPSDVGLTCAKVLRQFTGITNIPEPKTVQISQWNSDPYFKGAYSFRATEGDKIPGDISAVLAEPIYKTFNESNKPVLLLAGEALHREYYSTLHGAYESGRIQAKKLIEFLKIDEKVCQM